jgi:hypothetical protein
MNIDICRLKDNRAGDGEYYDMSCLIAWILGYKSSNSSPQAGEYVCIALQEHSFTPVYLLANSPSDQFFDQQPFRFRLWATESRLHPDQWQIIQQRSLTMSGEPSSPPSNSVSSEKREQRDREQANTINTTLLASIPVLDATRLSIRAQQSSRRAADGQHSLRAYREQSADMRIERLG